MKSENKTLDLLTEISEPSFLRKAWGSLNKANKESKGLNSETIKEFQDTLETKIQDISKQLRKKTYTFQPVRGVLIPKKEKGKYRPLRIADIGDRLVCKAIAIKLDDLLTPIFNLNNEASFAYRKNTGIADAIKQIVKHYNNGNKIILEADIVKFFDNVDRDILLEKIFKNIPDSTLNDLIRSGLSQEVGNITEHTINAHYFEDSVNGIPQGNALSPLFANIYLSDFDAEVLNSGYKLVRYADDFVVLCQSHDEAKKAYQLTKSILEEKLKLKVHELKNEEDAKTKIVNPSFDKFQFLSIRFDGNNLWVDKKKVQSLKEKIRDVTDTDSNKNLITVLTKTRNLLEGWLAAFKFVDLERDIPSIDDYVDIQLYNVFRNFDFGIKTKYLREIKYKDANTYGLTKVQRQKTGVKNCMEFLSTMDRDKIFP